MKRIGFLSVSMLFLGLLLCGPASSGGLDKWKPNFDFSKAKYKIKVSNLSTPASKGVAVGFAIRDELWKRTNGRIYFEYLPLSVLGAELECLNQVRIGAIQGISASTGGATNLGPRFGMVNLPFLVNDQEKLEKFVGNKKLFEHYLAGAEHLGIIGMDVSTYGRYGWITKKPVRTLEEARKTKIRILESKLHNMIYRSWGFSPVVMPWPDVVPSIKQGVIDGLDHTMIVGVVFKYFETAPAFTEIYYSQGIFVWLFNRAWFETLPPDLQKIFEETIHDVCKQYRQEDYKQAEGLRKIALEKMHTTFTRLSDKEMAYLKEKGDEVHKKYSPQVNRLYKNDTYRPKDYLKEVQDFLAY